MVEGCDVEGMVVAVLEEIAGKSEIVPQEVAENRDVLDVANIVSAILRRSLLPVPPEPIQVGVVEEE